MTNKLDKKINNKQKMKLEITDSTHRNNSNFDEKKITIIDGSGETHNDKQHNQDNHSETNPNTKVMLESIGAKYF